MKSLMKGYGREKRLGTAVLDIVESSTSHNPIGLHGLSWG
jgi:hypothetical protein